MTPIANNRVHYVKYGQGSRRFDMNLADLTPALDFGDASRVICHRLWMIVTELGSGPMTTGIQQDSVNKGDN